MTIRYEKSFKKSLRHLKQQQKHQFDERLRLLLANPADTRLRLHPLKGKFTGYYSINVSGDLRAIFRREDHRLTFILIGTHSQLYG